jgi:hypothetical protein
LRLSDLTEGRGYHWLRITLDGPTRDATQPGTAAMTLQTTNAPGIVNARATVGTDAGEVDPTLEATRFHAHCPPAMPSGMPTTKATKENMVTLGEDKITTLTRFGDKGILAPRPLWAAPHRDT